MENIIVTFTTIPERVNLIPRVLNSLRNQTIKPSKVYIQTPIKTRKGKHYDIDKIKNIAESFRDINTTVNIIDVDEGPITKLAPVLDLEKDPNSNIILVDDDIIYGETIIETLLKYKDLKAVGFAGEKYNPKTKKLYYSGNNFFLIRVSEVQNADFLEAFHGVLYKRELFPPSTKDFIDWVHTLPEICIFSDDMIIGAWLDSINQPRFIVPTNGADIISDPKDTPQLKTDNSYNGRNKEIFTTLCNAGYFKSALIPNDSYKYGFDVELFYTILKYLPSILLIVLLFCLLIYLYLFKKFNN